MSTQGKWAVVTGASSGIGMDLARQLAGRGYHVLVTARRLDRLDSLAAEIRAAHGVEVACVALDLGAIGAPGELFATATREGRRLHVLVNNAGFGDYTEFEHQEAGRIEQMLRLNVVALTELAWLFVRHARAHGQLSHLLNVASIAAYQPVPYFAVYAASKSYVRDFSEAIAFELRGTNVGVSCLCPGGTVTEFSNVAGQILGPLARSTMLSSGTVAHQGLEAMFRRRSNVVTGWINKVACCLTRFGPRQLAARLAAWALGGRPPPPPSA